MKFVAVAFVAIATSSAMASVGGFVETFSGIGSYDGDPDWGEYKGLDNPGWRIIATGSRVTSNGLVITTEADQFDPDDVATTYIDRALVGVGSFMESIEINMFDSVVPFASHSTASLWFDHYSVELPDFGNAASLAFSRVYEEESLYLFSSLITDHDTGTSELSQLPDTSRFRLSISYDYFNQSVSFEYLDLETDEIGFSSGPLEWSVP
ncbi:MAG: hypothetical protein KDA87_23250, partial [Planctomycetales bacterium]|nr:hypothetical protein [Planctomycetales bacterium]